MTRVHTISNREYHPAGDIGKHFGYTRDYILMLAREGKIDGKKIGHRWYVNFESAQNFFDKAKVDRDVRKQQIREERLRELQTREKKVAACDRVSHVTPLLATSLLASVMLVALLVGTLPVNQSAQILSSVEESSSPWANFAQALYDFFSFKEVKEVAVSPEEILGRGIGTQGEGVHDPIEDRTVTTTRTVHTSLVIGPDETMTVTEMELIRDTFSDEVSISIDPENPDTGIVIPHFKKGEGEAYRFLMVPVDGADSP